jgi:pimeloyl-ACP methyl ester carboxylesterase
MSKVTNTAAPEAGTELVPEAASGNPVSPRFEITRRRMWRMLSLLALFIMVVLAAFGPFPWQLLGQASLLLAVVVVAVLAVAVLLIMFGITTVTRQSGRIVPWTQRLMRLTLTLSILLVALVGATIGSQWHASTPQIQGAHGQPLPGSIATMEQVTLNGSKEWITIRGKSATNPVLLYLNGGPGAGGFPWSNLVLKPLEDHFVVVNWDQPNTGKSYGDVSLAQITPQRYVSDAYALTQMLCARFHQDKIYVLGDSWGSILGILLVQQHPEMFCAYIGSGQMVNPAKNDIMGYQFALTYAAQHGDSGTVDELRRNGPPPYTGDGMVWKYVAYLNVLNSYMGDADYRLSLLLVSNFAPEYGLWDKVKYMRGMVETFSTLYPQLQGMDFTTQAARLEVPVFFLEGRNDVNAISSLAENYYHVLQAPYKELIWFNAGHAISAAGNDKVVDAFVNHVLKQTWPGR